MGKSGIVASVAGALLLAACGGDSEQATPTPAPTTPEPDPIALSFLPAEFRATGTEPFWSAAVTRDQLTYTTPENNAAGGVTVPVVRQDGAENALLTATLDGQPFQLLVTPGACSDGMSDKIYPWTVERTLGEESVNGCAEPPSIASETPKAP